MADDAAHGYDRLGLMVESNLFEGNQPFPKNPAELRYGVSISDACLGWDATERMMRWGHEALSKARQKTGAGKV